MEDRFAVLLLIWAAIGRKCKNCLQVEILSGLHWMIVTPLYCWRPVCRFLKVTGKRSAMKD